jgi:hypothetical protein
LFDRCHFNIGKLGRTGERHPGFGLALEPADQFTARRFTWDNDRAAFAAFHHALLIVQRQAGAGFTTAMANSAKILGKNLGNSGIVRCCAGPLGLGFGFRRTCFLCGCFLSRQVLAVQRCKFARSRRQDQPCCTPDHNQNPLYNDASLPTSRAGCFLFTVSRKAFCLLRPFPVFQTSWACVHPFWHHRSPRI